MKILSVGYALEKASGVTTFVEETAAGLRALGHYVKVVDILKDADRTGDVGKYDIVHLHCLWQLHKYAVAARKAKVPIVWSTHGMTAPWAMRHKRLKKKAAWWMFQRRDLLKAAAIHCTTEQESEWNRRLGIKNCFIVPLGTSENCRIVRLQDCSIEGESSSRTAAKSRNGTVSNGRVERVMLFVGRIHPVKGLENLIRAWGLVVGRGLLAAGGERWKLRIVGPDEDGYLARLKSEVRSLGLDSSVEFPGPRFGEDLGREYENCDCLVLPSFTENFGATVVDAMAHGKPVLTSTFTPWREVMERGCGWWVSNAPERFAHALKELMEMDDKSKAARGEKGRELAAEKYSWPAVDDKMLDAYRRVVKEEEES